MTACSPRHVFALHPLPAAIAARLSTVVLVFEVLSRPDVCELRFINSWAAQNWRQFSSVNYFDKSGIFISAVVSAPLCAIAFVVVILQASGVTHAL